MKRWITGLALVLVTASLVGMRQAWIDAGSGAGSVLFVPFVVRGDLPTPTVSEPTLVPVGPGYTDVSTHQIVRTVAGRVYVFVPELGNRIVHAYRATNLGTPGGFSEVDTNHRPTGSGEVSAVDAAIDGNGLVHVIWLDDGGPVNYQTFDTGSDTWGTPTTLADGGVWPNPQSGTRQGSEGVALAVDSAGRTHVVYTKVESGVRRLWYRNNVGGAWSAETRVDDVPSHDNGHPALAFDGKGRLYVAWLVEQTGTNTGDIRLRSRGPDGTWDPSSNVIDTGGNVFSDDRFAIDQGPSLIVTRDGTRHVAYIASWQKVVTCPSNAYEYGAIQYKYDAGSGWTSMNPTPTHFTHDPSLATNASNDVLVFGHDDACLNPDSASMYDQRRALDGSWGPFTLLAAGPYDSSVSAKWSWNFLNDPGRVEVVFFTQNSPNQVYYASLP